jgi:hypothetical protein
MARQQCKGTGKTVGIWTGTGQWFCHCRNFTRSFSLPPPCDMLPCATICLCTSISPDLDLRKPGQTSRYVHDVFTSALPGAMFHDMFHDMFV